jgi:cytochrome c55X
MTTALLLAVLVNISPLQAEVSGQRQAELLHMLKHDCGSCHGMTLKGGLGPALLPETLAGKPNEFLEYTILNGRPPTPMPPWRGILTGEEVAWLVKLLRKGVD